MSVSSTIRIGRDTVDINKPADVVVALRKMELLLGTGGNRVTVRIDGEEVTYSEANDERLQKLISFYERKAAQSAGKRTRFARRVRFS